MAKELEKLSEKDIQERLYGGYRKKEPKLAEKPPVPSSKERPLRESKKNTGSGTGLRIVGVFAAGIALVLLAGFLMTRMKKPSETPSKAVPAKPTAPSARKTPVTGPKVTPPPAVSRPYTIQVMVYENREGAEKAVDDLKKRGFPAYVKENKTVSGKLQLRIYVGEFVTQEEARSTLAMLKSNPNYNESFIRKK